MKITQATFSSTTPPRSELPVRQTTQSPLGIGLAPLDVKRTPSQRINSHAMSQTDLRANGAKSRFALDFTAEALLVAAGSRTQTRQLGGTAVGTAIDGVRIVPDANGRIRLENLNPDYMGTRTESVVMEADGHGGYYGFGSKGEWTLSPESKSGVRELVHTPARGEGDIVQYRLGIPRPPRDLAAWHATRVALDDGRQVHLDASGPHLALTMDDGTVLTLRHQDETGTYVDRAAGDPMGPPRAKLYLHPDAASYQLVVDGSSAMVGPFATSKPVERTELCAFRSDGGEHVNRATLTRLPKGKLMLRLSETTADVPAVIYLDAANEKGNHKGVTRRGDKVKLRAADEDGGRTLTIKLGSGEKLSIVLAPFDEKQALSPFVGATAKVSITAPPTKNPQGQLKHTTLTLHFENQLTNGDRVRVLSKPGGTITSVMIPNAFGEYVLNVSGGKLLVRPREDGGFAVDAVWDDGRRSTGTLTLQ